MMEIKTFDIEGLMLFVPHVFEDERGYFLESFNEIRYREAGLTEAFVQDNESLSSKHIVRGLHLQDPPFAQGKLVRVVSGSIFDVAVDVRKNSATYGKFVHVLLSGRGHEQFWIPKGFAHGFMALEDNTIINYKCTDYYNKSSERTIRWDDPDLAIPWPGSASLVSSKDNRGELFRDFVSMFH